jgi:hypothetical protein
MQIIHKPYGKGHPSEQLPEERFPRQPLAGQAFKVGIVTRSPGETRAVTVFQQLEGQPVTTKEARNLADWKAKQEEGVGAKFLERMEKVEQDAWEAELTAPAFGQTLIYWFEADGVRSADFVLRGEQWRSGGGWTSNGLTMKISRHAEKSTPNPSLPELLDVSWLDDGKCACRVRLTFRGQPDEGFFGLGERFNALNQRGNIMDIRVYEQYKDQGKRTYMPIPFLLSSAGYGLYVNSSRWMQFDVAATAADQWTLEADLGAAETLNLTWFSGDDPLEIVGQFSRMTGPPALPPEWAFGLWMSANEWNSQARVEEEVKASLEHGIPPSVVVIEARSDEISFYVWNDAQYTPPSWGRRLMLQRFHLPRRR